MIDGTEFDILVRLFQDNWYFNIFPRSPFCPTIRNGYCLCLAWLLNSSARLANPELVFLWALSQLLAILGVKYLSSTALLCKFQFKARMNLCQLNESSDYTLNTCFLLKPQKNLRQLKNENTLRKLAVIKELLEKVFPLSRHLVL